MLYLASGYHKATVVLSGVIKLLPFADRWYHHWCNSIASKNTQFECKCMLLTCFSSLDDVIADVSQQTKCLLLHATYSTPYIRAGLAQPKSINFRAFPPLAQGCSQSILELPTSFPSLQLAPFHGCCLFCVPNFRVQGWLAIIFGHASALKIFSQP